MPNKPDFEPSDPSICQELKRIHERLDAFGFPFHAIEHRLAIIEAELRGIRHGLHAPEDKSSAACGLARSVHDLSGRVAAIEKHLGLHQTIEF